MQEWHDRLQSDERTEPPGGFAAKLQQLREIVRMTADQGRVSVRHPLLAGALPTAGGRGPRGSSVGTIILHGHDRTRQGSVRVTANATASLSFGLKASFFSSHSLFRK